MNHISTGHTPALKDVRQQFEAWRESRASKRERIPDHLWQAAVKLCRKHSVCQISKSLGLCSADLKRSASPLRKRNVHSDVHIPIRRCCNETITFTDFRKKASDFITKVERGETLILLRQGKPVAEISPYHDEIPRTPSWKKPGIRLEIKGSDLSSAILKEREGGI